MAWMASARMASALAMTASSSLSSPVTICWLKVLISANSARICSVISWASFLEFAIEAFSSWISLYVVRTFSSSSASSFSRRLSCLVLAEISALAFRVAFFWFSILHFSAMSAFRGIWEWRSSILYCAAFTSSERREDGRLARAWPEVTLGVGILSARGFSVFLWSHVDAS